MSRDDDLPLPFLGGEEIAAFGVEPAAAALAAALAGGLDPESQPPRQAVAAGAGELLVMSGLSGGHGAVKAVTVGAGKPRVQGLCTLFELERMAPVALLDGAALTELRTAAVSVLALRLLAAPGAGRALVFGRGPQARAHERALRASFGIDRIETFGRGERPDPAAVAAAEVICCCTSAAAPLFDGALVSERACVVAIGSHTPGRRETDDALAARATVVVESRRAALREAGDVVGAVRAGALAASELVTLAELVRGGAPAAAGPRLFKGVGAGWQDAVVAAAILAARLSRGPGTG